MKVWLGFFSSNTYGILQWRREKDGRQKGSGGDR